MFRIFLNLLVPFLLLGSSLFFLFPKQEIQKSKRVQELETALLKTDPEILLLGNSMLLRAIDRERLAQHFGIKKEKVQIIWFGGATIATLYVVLNERILKNGLRPKLIIFGTTPYWLLANSITDVRGKNLAEQLGEYDPVVAKRLDLSALPIHPRQAKQRDLREELLSSMRNQIGWSLFGFPTSESKNRLQTLFAPKNRRRDSGTRVIPIREPKSPQKFNTALSIENSFLAPIAERTQQYGIPSIIVSLPIRAGVSKEKAQIEEIHQTLSPQLHQAAIQEMRRLNLPYVEYTQTQFPPPLFADEIHLNEEGRTKLTNLFLNDLERLSVASKDHF